MQIAVIVIAFLVFVVVAVLVQRKAGAATRRIDDGLAQLDVLRKDKAHLMGELSGGDRQAKSIGALALTPDELVFLQLVPERQVRVGRSDIGAVEVSQEFLGKTHTRELLIVRWGEGDDVDGLAFDVDEATDWAMELRG
jgi:ABC-type uncharacterized transport system ATPase subunit